MLPPIPAAASKDDVTLTYSKRAKKETYTESYGGHATRLIIDHDKGTLTLIEPAL